MNTKQLADLHHKFHKLIDWLADHGFHEEFIPGQLLYIRKDALYERRVYFDWNTGKITRKTVLLEPFLRGYKDFMELEWGENPFPKGSLAWSSYKKGQLQASQVIDAQIHDPERWK